MLGKKQRQEPGGEGTTFVTTAFQRATAPSGWAVGAKMIDACRNTLCKERCSICTECLRRVILMWGNNPCTGCGAARPCHEAREQKKRYIWCFEVSIIVVFVRAIHWGQGGLSSLFPVTLENHPNIILCNPFGKAQNPPHNMPVGRFAATHTNPPIRIHQTFARLWTIDMSYSLPIRGTLSWS